MLLSAWSFQSHFLIEKVSKIAHYDLGEAVVCAISDCCVSLVYKSKNGLAPEYLSNVIVPANSNQSYNTRFSSQDNLIVPKPNTESFKSSFTYSGPKIWNSLTPEIKKSNSVFEFKHSYKSLYFW